VGAFTHTFSIARSGETTDRIKKVRGCKNGKDLLYHLLYGGDRESRAGCRRKSVMFYCLSRLGITKFVITETLLSSVISKTIMVSLHRGRFVVEHLYSIFSVDFLNFPLGANLYQKLAFFVIWRAVNPHF